MCFISSFIESGRVGPGLGYETPGRAWAARPLYIIGPGWPASGKHRARAGPGREIAARAHLYSTGLNFVTTSFQLREQDVDVGEKPWRYDVNG
ncbi:hypothetical protein HPB50_026732 [Hyalomma asiaticum]|uniref:Uncharacterized protein n=1 Tax=Hyalomma asiaticum TaxID=266040 RepID=A0ACB7SRR5_HYAAI|nr:hypothetical protein HPB50_026732 [Hyalomma asiaticum]